MVGVILNLSVWFALHVLFGEVRLDGAVPVPVWASFSAAGAGLSVLAMVLLVGLRLPMGAVLALLAALAGTGFLVT